MSMFKLRRLVPPAIVLALAGAACQTAQRPAALLPSSQASAPVLTAAASPDPQSAPERKANPASVTRPELGPRPQPDPVAELIAKVEKEYQAGQDNYKAGNVEAARQSFDRAFDLLINNHWESSSDERLEREFDRILDGVNSLDLEPPQEDADSTKQLSPPAPIDEVNQTTPPVDAHVKAQAEAEVKATHSDLPLMMTDQVAGYINYFSTRGRGTLERALVRSGRYQHMIHRILKDEGVPQDLIYLAQAESGFQPLALSRAGARGMWQFMASRAKAYGLERNLWMDERQDPEKSTRAAARHLKDLYNEFGDWYLAMAAYNSGPGTILQAVKRTGYADFWQLYRRNVLPKETRNYVPIILAVTIMAKNPTQYGLETVAPEAPVPYDTVMIDYPVDLRLVAECVDAPATTLQDLNPSLLRWTTPKNPAFELHLPKGTKNEYLTAIAAVPQDMRPWWRYHKVAAGDTLASVARTYRTTPQAIAQANGLDSNQKLPADNKLLIPITAGKHPLAEDAQRYARGSTRYLVHKGDTVQSVADNFGVPPSMVRRWNHLKGDSLRGHHVLYVHLPVPLGAREIPRKTASKSKPGKTLTAAHKPSVRHTVKQGETLTSIAASHHTTVEALKKNNGNLAVLRPGMVLLIRDSR